MKRYFSLLKKNILCFAAILLITITATTALPSKCIDFKWSEKPANMSIYEWCKKRAEASVNLKLIFLLTFIKIKSAKEWDDYKKGMSKQSECPVANPLAMSKKIQKCVYDLFYYHEVVKIVKPTSIRKESKKGKVKKIIVETANFGTIEVIAVSGSCLGWTMTSKDKHVIGLCSIQIESLKLSDDAIIGGIIGHELAHIIYGDHLQHCVINNIYEKKCCDLSSSEYDKYLCAYSRASEVEADIVGTFGNPRWVKGSLDLSKMLVSSYEYSSMFSTHPTWKQRVAFLEEIYKFLSSKSELL